MRLREKINTVLGFIVLIGFFGSCVHSIGSPWNCEQAKQMRDDAKQEVESAYNDQSANPRENLMPRIQSKLYRLNDLESKVLDKCN